MPTPSLTLYRRDAVLRYPVVGPRNPPVSTRGAVLELSKRSRARLAFVAQNTDAAFASMLTLTYAPEVAPRTGKVAKRGLNAFLTAYRRKVGGQYLWFMEFTGRGIAHFHILSDRRPPHPVRQVRPGSWQNLQETREWCGRWATIAGARGEVWRRMSAASVSWELLRSSEGGRRYVTKYAYKTAQKILPQGFGDVGRWWGASRGVKPEPVLHLSLQEALQRGWVTEADLHAFDSEGDRIPYRVQFGLADRMLGKPSESTADTPPNSGQT